MEQYREKLKDKKRIVVKIGSSSLQHPETGELDYIKLEVLVRELCNLKNQGKEVVLVTSGAIAQGKKAMNLKEEDITEHNRIAMKQACAAIGQSRLMMTYQRIFSEYNQVTAQILMTKNTIVDNLNRYNAHNTFSQLLQMVFSPDGPDDILLGSSAPRHHLDSDEEMIGAPAQAKDGNGVINEDMASLDELLNKLVDTDEVYPEEQED